MIDWEDPDAIAVDGFTVDEIREMAADSVVTARCTECECDATVEPDARHYNCENCGAIGTVTSPLVKLCLI